MSDTMDFQERIITHRITAEACRHYAKIEPSEAREPLEQIAKSIENSYAAVVSVNKAETRLRDDEWVIQAIPKYNADAEDIGRAMQSVMHRLVEDHAPEDADE